MPEPRRRIGDVLPSRGLRSPTGDCAPARALWQQTQSPPRKYVLDVGGSGSNSHGQFEVGAWPLT